MGSWKVTGEYRPQEVIDAHAAAGAADTVEDLKEPFEATYTADSAQGARWQARRAFAPGKPLATLEDCPPAREREAIELGDADEPRAQARTGKDSAEYDRLVLHVYITDVAEVA